MSGADQPPAASRPSNQINSVEPSAADSEYDEYEQKVHERVLDFIDAYPNKADLQISEQHGRSLRRVVTEAEYQDVYVETEKEVEQNFQVSELQRRESVTWADAVSSFLFAHTEYRGLTARFSNQHGETFEIPLMDAWSESYSKKEYARARALEREMGGGERPTGGSSVGQWENPVTAMLTLTASSTPKGSRLPPVDHLDAIHDAFSKHGVRDALRNTMEYHLDLDSDDWAYWSQAEPHGMGAASDADKAPGANACYTHLHVGIYFDRDALAPSISLEDVGRELERVIDAHIEKCEPAGFSAHDYTAIDSYVEESDGCISLNPEVENMGSYMAAYMGGYTEDLLEKPVEYLAWGALYWSGSRRRVSRSQIVNNAITADACEQRFESSRADQDVPHGEHVYWNDGRGADVVCACCDSAWRIDQDRLDPPDDALGSVGDETESGNTPVSHFDKPMSERWPSARAGGSTGENLKRTQLRDEILSLIEDRPGKNWSVPKVMGRLGVSPSDRSFVEDVLESRATEPESNEFEKPEPLTDQWELDAVIDRDGEEHDPGGGGVDVVPLHLPLKRLQEETRLSIPLQKAEVYRCRKCGFSSHEARTMAMHFYEHGLEEPEAADRVLHYQHYHDKFGSKRPETEYPYSNDWLC
ncbi:hypothetical protein [Natronomonas gomsonensis]|uniref:hypothetical protein n=1 Tax=Natronomonas gomsonensis TaxID=1046043 RepID=UPI0020CA3AD7|nr:hypothetical protein [Natronomonas gomsonensis]